MCDYHSIVVFRDGQIAHVPSNSHSQAVAASGRAENTHANPERFAEFEWDGRGDLPSIAGLLADGRKDVTLTQAQERAALRHYGKLAEVHADPAKAFDPEGYFAADCYFDVRYAAAGNPSTPADVLSRALENEHEDVRCAAASQPVHAAGCLSQGAGGWGCRRAPRGEDQS